jgi:hypothetical protein
MTALLRLPVEGARRPVEVRCVRCRDDLDVAHGTDEDLEQLRRFIDRHRHGDCLRNLEFGAR